MQKTCKKCNRKLPEGYKYSYCENCRNERTDNLKKIGKSALGILGSAALLFITKGKLKK